MDSCYDVLPLLLKRWENWQDCAHEYINWSVKYVSKFPLHEHYLKNIRMERGRKDKLYYLYVVNEHQEKANVSIEELKADVEVAPSE